MPLRRWMNRPRGYLSLIDIILAAATTTLHVEVYDTQEQRRREWSAGLDTSSVENNSSESYFISDPSKTMVGELEPLKSDLAGLCGKN